MQEVVVHEEEDGGEGLPGVSKNRAHWIERSFYRRCVCTTGSLIRMEESVETSFQGIYYPRTFTNNANP